MAKSTTTLDIYTSGGGSGAVSSVSNSDGTLTISPTTGAVVASLNLNNGYSWAAPQTFTESGILLQGGSTGVLTMAFQYTGGNATVTFPNNTGTVAELNLAQAFTAIQTFNSQNIGTTLTDAVLLSNTTAAANGAQQYSPSIHWQGQGWKTTAIAASQTVDIISALVPIQGTTSPTGKLIFEGQINGGGYNGNNIGFVLSSSGQMGMYVSGAVGNNVFTVGNNSLSGNGIVSIYSTFSTTVPTLWIRNSNSQTADSIQVANSSSVLQWSIAPNGIQNYYKGIATVGSGVSPIYGAGLNVSLNTTSTAVASYTPNAVGLFRISWVLSCATSSTPTLSLTYTDTNAGMQTITLYSTAMTNGTVQSGVFILESVSGTAIAITGSDGTALGDIFASATIEQLQ